MSNRSRKFKKQIAKKQRKMEYRKLEFKKVEILNDDETDPKTGNPLIRGILDYRQTVRDMLTLSTDGRGSSSDELVQAVDIYSEIKKAYRDGKDSVLLDEEAYKFLLQREKTFRWALISTETREFVKYLRDLPKFKIDPNASSTAKDANVELVK